MMLGFPRVRIWRAGAGWTEGGADGHAAVLDVRVNEGGVKFWASG